MASSWKYSLRGGGKWGILKGTKGLGMVSRRAFLGLLGAGVGAMAAGPAAAQSAQRAQGKGKRPNIVLFMVDDMGWQDTSVPFYYEDGKAVRTRLNKRYATRTPNMERLAKQGMLFTDAYACAVCSPTRCSLMSGMNAARHRVTDWTLGVDQQSRFGAHGEGLFPPRWSANGLQPPGTQAKGVCQPPWRTGADGKFYQPALDAPGGNAYDLKMPFTNALAFPQLLQDAGYHTIHVGKAHWGSGSGQYNRQDSKAPTTPGADPRRFGFDVNIAGCEVGGPQNYRGDAHYGNKAYSQFATPGLDENGYYQDNVFLTDALTDMALRELERSHAAEPDRPFYLYMAHYAIHSPLDNGRAWDASRSDDPNVAKDARNPNPNDGLKWDPMERNYSTLIQGMDDSLGKLLDKLDALGETENTLFIFMADNGGLSISGRLKAANAPARAGKGSCYEGGTREPLIVCWPGKVRPGAVCHEPVIIEDFYPTILHAAGVPPPKALAVTPAGVHDDGPLRQVLDGETFLPVLLGRRATVRADGSERPLLWHYPNYWGEGIPGPEYHFYTTLRLGRWKLIYQHSDQSFELYDLRTDIGERRDLADQRPGLVDKLRKEMGRLLRERGAQMPRIGGPDGKAVPYPDEVALAR